MRASPSWGIYCPVVPVSSWGIRFLGGFSHTMRDWMQVLQYTAAPVVHFQNVDPLFYEAWYVGLLVLRQDRTILFLRISIQYTVFSFKTHLVIPSLSTNSFFSQDGSEPSNIVVKWWMVVELCSYAVSLPSLSSNLLSSWSAGSFFSHPRLLYD